MNKEGTIACALQARKFNGKRLELAGSQRNQAFAGTGINTVGSGKQREEG
ncbi:hypothetical protein [Marinobacter persicus]|nr:hypothetical protein [Marinobacter persicus]